MKKLFKKKLGFAPWLKPSKRTNSLIDWKHLQTILKSKARPSSKAASAQALAPGMSLQKTRICVAAKKTLLFDVVWKFGSFSWNSKANPSPKRVSPDTHTWSVIISCTVSRSAMRRWYQMIVCCSSAFPTSLVIVRSVCTATNIPNHCVPNEQCCYMLLHYVPYQYIKIHLNNSETHQASRQASPKHFAEQTRPDRYWFINKALYRTATASRTGVLRGYSGCSIHLQLPGKFFLHRSKFTTSLFEPYSASCQRMHQRWTIMFFWSRSLVFRHAVRSIMEHPFVQALCVHVRWPVMRKPWTPAISLTLSTLLLMSATASESLSLCSMKELLLRISLRWQLLSWQVSLFDLLLEGLPLCTCNILQLPVSRSSLDLRCVDVGSMFII